MDLTDQSRSLSDLRRRLLHDPDPDWARIVARAYNNRPPRIFPKEQWIRFAAIVPLQDPEEAVREARRGRDLAAASILMVTAPSDRGYRKSLGDVVLGPLRRDGGHQSACIPACLSDGARLFHPICPNPEP
jgi:hypothetical protein